MDELISRQAAIDALWKALYEYEDKAEKQFQESEDLDVGDWIQHRNFVQDMSDIDRQVIMNMPPAEPQRMRAKWIATTSLQEGQITWIDYKCSNCSHHRSKPMNFCEICGAKMERGEMMK